MANMDQPLTGTDKIKDLGVTFYFDLNFKDGTCDHHCSKGKETCRFSEETGQAIQKSRDHKISDVYTW